MIMHAMFHHFQENPRFFHQEQKETRYKQIIIKERDCSNHKIIVHTKLSQQNEFIQIKVKRNSSNKTGGEPNKYKEINKN